MKTNEDLRNDVMEELKWDPELRDISTEIGVATKDGVVTLSGNVDTYWKKISAEKAAQRVSGVRVVACDIDVKIGSIGKRTDTEVAEAVRNALRWNSAVNEDRIEVKVDNGWVYLDGKVGSASEKMNAQQSVEDLVAVRGVANNIVIESKPIDSREIHRKITAAYHRSATIDATSVIIDTTTNKVTLRGKVRSMAERQEAEKIAWAAPGVAAVDNQIEVENEIFA